MTFLGKLKYLKKITGFRLDYFPYIIYGARDCYVSIRMAKMSNRLIYYFIGLKSSISKLTIFFGSPLWWPFTFAARGRRSWLLPKATTSLKSQKPIFAAGGRHIFLWPEATRLSKSHVPTEIGTMVTILINANYLTLNKGLSAWTM